MLSQFVGDRRKKAMVGVDYAGTDVIEHERPGPVGAFRLKVSQFPVNPFWSFGLSGKSLEYIFTYNILASFYADSGATSLHLAYKIYYFWQRECVFC